MGLVEYSDSESESEPPQTSAPATAAAAASQPAKKQNFQKLVDKSNPSKILVNLPSAPSESDDAESSEAPAAKRLKVSGSRFSGFSSFLPPPKATASRPPGGNSGKAAPRVGVNLRTSSEAAFSRDPGYDGGDGLPSTITAAAQPSIPHGQKSEDEVKLVGKPMMFKPLSVARNPSKKPVGTKTAAVAVSTTKPRCGVLDQPTKAGASAAPTDRESQAAPMMKKKKISLFSVAEDTHSAYPATEEAGPSYQTGSPGYDDGTFADGTALNDYADHHHQQQQRDASYSEKPAQQAGYPDPTSLDSIADDLNLGPAARRELFGRGGAPNKATAKSVINFNLDQEYRHNEELRQSGALDQQQHNPLRAIKPGKHSLQQLVNQVQSQRDALEENFAKNRATQKQSGAKYGF
ncbi:hypothetical protein Daus18300_000642 [Diaporthe australafricana]|uniref:Stress activated map kinase interacting n=1 Tax=Diaporthe australafricana TaxID=127596 RepID=A0ABR3Y2N5_9PEZI